GDGLEAAAVEVLVGELDELGAAGAVVDVEVALVDREVEGGGEEVLDLALLGFEELLVGLDLLVGALGDGGLEEPRRRELLGVAGDDDALASREDGKGLFEATLGRLVEDDDGEDLLAREELGDGL